MVPAQVTNTHEIDVSNLMCPMPIIKVEKSMNDLRPGDVLKISARGESTLKDLSAYCANTGNQLIEHIKIDEELIFFIRKS